MTFNHPREWQPLHPSIRPLLDPQYVAVHDQYMVYVEPDHLKPWDSSARTSPSLFNGCQEPVIVDCAPDLRLGSYSVRVYRPVGVEGSLPVFIWFHGGGWAIGSAGDNADLLTRICRDSRCLVVSVDYRLAPENPFPAALIDSLDALRWVASKPAVLGDIDTQRISVGGLSAGGNLAVVVALIAANPGVTVPSIGEVDLGLKSPLAKCVLIVPVIDNTATVEGVWAFKAETAPWLTPERMLWYRRMYFGDGNSNSKADDDSSSKADDGSSSKADDGSSSKAHGWDASPNYAEDDLLKNLCETHVFYSEFDLLADEAVAFTRKLQSLGIKAKMEMVEGGTHSILVLSRVVDRGKRLIEDVVKLVAE